MAIALSEQEVSKKAIALTVKKVRYRSNTPYKLMRSHYPQYTDPLAIEWWTTATLNKQPYLIPNRQITPKIYTDYPHIAIK